MLLFGVLQIFMSQIPNFHDMLWLSVVAAVMSFAYSSIGLGLAFGQIIGKDISSIVFRLTLLCCFCYQPVKSNKSNVNSVN